jgi:hypothetical protein
MQSRPTVSEITTGDQNVSTACHRTQKSTISQGRELNRILFCINCCRRICRGRYELFAGTDLESVVCVVDAYEQNKPLKRLTKNVFRISTANLKSKLLRKRGSSCQQLAPSGGKRWNYDILQPTSVQIFQPI